MGGNVVVSNETREGAQTRASFETDEADKVPWASLLDHTVDAPETKTNASHTNSAPPALLAVLDVNRVLAIVWIRVGESVGTGMSTTDTEEKARGRGCRRCKEHRTTDFGSVVVKAAVVEGERARCGASGGRLVEQRTSEGSRGGRKGHLCRCHDGTLSSVYGATILSHTVGHRCGVKQQRSTVSSINGATET